MKTKNDIINPNFQIGQSVGERKSMEIADHEKMVSATLDNLYKNPHLAVVTELCTNAAEVADTIYVHIPTELEPWFSVRDDGPGMEKELCEKACSGLGFSTKDVDNDTDGGWGVGMKVGFAVSDNYTITNRHNGMMYVYSAYRDELNIPRFSLLSETPTDQCNGFEVNIPVQISSYKNNYKANLMKVASYFKAKIIVENDNSLTEELEPVSYVLSQGDWGLRKKNPNSYPYDNARVVMGMRSYNIEPSELFHRDVDSKLRKLISAPIDIRLPIGSVTLPLSRENIVYTDKTINTLKDKIKEVYYEFVKLVKQEVSKASNVWEACKIVSESNLAVSLNNDDLTYKGMMIDGSRIAAKPSFDFTGYLVGSYELYKNVVPLAANRLNPTYEDKVLLYYKDIGSVDVMIFTDTDQRLPSRLGKHYSEPNQRVPSMLYMIKYNDKNKSTITRWVKFVFGVEPMVFSDTVKDYKVARSKAKGRAYNLKYFDPHLWGDDSGFKSYEQDLDLDTNEGLYVDLRRGFPDGNKYHYSKSTISAILNILKAHKVVSDTVTLYGCPGNVKNRMADHSNFMSLDEAVDLFLERGETKKLSFKELKEVYAKSMKKFARNERIFNLDIKVDNGYYSTCKYVIDKFKDTELTNILEDYETVKRCVRLSYQSDDVSIEERISDKFYSKYPVLQHIDYPYYLDSEESIKLSESVTDYIDMVHNCK